MKEKIAYLEGLRGYAALTVVVLHFLATYFPAFIWGKPNTAHNVLELFLFSSPFGILLTVFYNGNLAVFIFFILSGFVLSYKFFKNGDSKAVTEGIAKRYFRLVIPALASVLIAYFLLRNRLFFNGTAALSTGSVWLGKLWAFKPNFGDMIIDGLFRNMFQNVYKYNLVLWTMMFELYGSMLVYAACSIIGKNRNRHWYYCMLIFILLFLNVVYIPFLLGLVLCDIFVNRRSVIESLPGWGIFPLLLCSIYIGAFNPDKYFFRYLDFNIPFMASFDKLNLFYTLSAFMIMLIFLRYRLVQRIFSNSFFRFLGNISFSLYLTHLIIICSLSNFIFLYLMRHQFSYNSSALISIIISFPVSIVAALAYYNTIDKPTVTLLSGFYKRYLS